MFTVWKDLRGQDRPMSNAHDAIARHARMFEFLRQANLAAQARTRAALAQESDQAAVSPAALAESLAAV